MVLVDREEYRTMPSTSFQINPEYGHITELVPGLYISGVPIVRSLASIPRIKLWLDDTPSTNIYQYFDLISDQIEAVITSGGNVLVHCVAGVSRSASVCLAFLTKFRCKSLRQAYQFMAQKRPLVRPNIGFWRQLIIYENELKNGVVSVKLLRNKDDPENVLPDVYPSTNADSYGERRFSRDKPKFQPILETVPESTEAGA
uniref:Dual specificity protein phosphatase 14 n=1 Tax=Setaria digitata TaxID=48799 RepID=A0A915Q594_9BILA